MKGRGMKGREEDEGKGEGREEDEGKGDEGQG